MSFNEICHKKGLIAISPIVVFLAMYVAVSIIVGDFYKMPIAVALVVASMWAVIISRGYNLTKRVEIYSKEAANPNVMYMLWIFILAGAFASLAENIGAIDATVNATLKILPPKFLIPGLFLAACFISISIGTSVGTVVALTPLAVQLADAAGGEVAFFVATVLGGAFFGDNLSFISDTTIAATRTQGCKMNDKFKINLWIALPAALLTLLLYCILTPAVNEIHITDDINIWLILPYFVIIITALCGIDVILVLSIGIVSAIIIALCNGKDVMSLFGYMGTGIDSMGGLIIITLLAAGMLGLIKAQGGINYILQCMTSRIRGRKGAQCSIAILVSIVNVCTANNTVAIITVGALSKDIAKRYNVDARKSASLLDTCSCITQCIIPYGAQALMATTLAGIAPIAPLPYLYYPFMLIIFVALSIVFNIPRLNPNNE